MTEISLSLIHPESLVTVSDILYGESSLLNWMFVFPEYGGSICVLG